MHSSYEERMRVCVCVCLSIISTVSVVGTTSHLYGKHLSFLRGSFLQSIDFFSTSASILIQIFQRSNVVFVGLSRIYFSCRILLCAHNIHLHSTDTLTSFWASPWQAVDSYRLKSWISVTLVEIGFWMEWKKKIVVGKRSCVGTLKSSCYPYNTRTA